MIQIAIDYYPEQWNPEYWEKDLLRMKAMGVNIIRLAEFSWSRLEPNEGEFHFEWLDHIMELLKIHDMKAILGTPTNCAPLWLYQDYPDTLHWERDGRPTFVGIRGHRCMNSPVFRKYAGRIVDEMAKRYAANPQVTAWQIDNELDSNHCSCPYCTKGFQNFAKEKYRTLDNLNQAWGTVVWSGEYSRWDQITPLLGPVKPDQWNMATSWYNPAYLLDYERFASAVTADFVRFQCDIIRKYNPNTTLTTNSCFSAHDPDFYQEFSPLSVASYDNYPPVVLPEDKEKCYSNAYALDFVRGFKQKNFWIMEQLGGPVGCWQPITPAMEPGMLMGYALQAVAHGADLLSFFRWRTACTGAEMFCHGLLDHSDQPNRRLQELNSLIKRLELYPELENSSVISKVAILFGFDQYFSFKNQSQSEEFSYQDQIKLFHDACMNLGVNVDVIEETSDLSHYKVVIVPCHFVTNTDVVNNLELFAQKGGTVIIAHRSGVKDKNGNCIFGKALPTFFSDMCGCKVTEYDAIGPKWQQIRLEDGSHYKITSWCDLLELTTASVWASYEGRFYHDVPAITRNSFGRGLVYYVGTVGEKALYHRLLQEIFKKKKIMVVETLPQGVELCVRSNKKKRYSFLFNNTASAKEVCYKGNSYKLSPFQMEIFESENK